MDSLLILLAGIVVGWWLHRISVLNRVLKDPDNFIKMLEKYKAAKQEVETLSEAEGYRPLKVEKHGDMIYLFAEDTDEFLAQAPTLQAALALVEKRFPNQLFKGHLDKEQVTSLGIKA
jgi:hypothetical protein